jgi:AcrR family transcriptional regulator
MSATSTVRKRNSTASRERLLQAARDLFAERGYERTTVRDIGQRADVDPTMIARYFGGKAALYLATLRSDAPSAEGDTVELGTAHSVQGFIERADGRGPTPTLYAVVRPHEDVELQKAAMEVLNRRLVTTASRKAGTAGHSDAQLRAEIAVAALAGIVLSRTTQTFPALATAESADVGRLVAEMLDSILT